MRTQREDKRVLSRVLSGLFELRHDLVFWRTLRMLLQDLNLTPQQEATVSVYLRQKLLPQFSQWRDRYKESVEELAGVDASLSLRLRHKAEDVFGMLDNVLLDFPSDPSLLDQLAVVENKLTNIQLPITEELMQGTFHGRTA